MSGPYLARATEQDVINLATRLEIVTAERDGALSAVMELLVIIGRDNGFQWPADQATVRAAKAMLVAHGVAMTERGGT